MILTNEFLKYRTKIRGCFCHIDQGYHKTIIFLLSNGHSCGNRCRCEQLAAIRQHPVLTVQKLCAHSPICAASPRIGDAAVQKCKDALICILSHRDSPIIPDIYMNCQENERFSVPVRNILPRVPLFSYTIYKCDL